MKGETFSLYSQSDAIFWLPMDVEVIAVTFHQVQTLNVGVVSLFASADASSTPPTLPPTNIKTSASPLQLAIAIAEFQSPGVLNDQPQTIYCRDLKKSLKSGSALYCRNNSGSTVILLREA